MIIAAYFLTLQHAVFGHSSVPLSLSTVPGIGTLCVPAGCSAEVPALAMRALTGGALAFSSANVLPPFAAHEVTWQRLQPWRSGGVAIPRNPRGQRAIEGGRNSV